MADPIVELADLVAADLDSAVLSSLGITAQRDYLPTYNLEELATDTPKVFVIARSEESAIATREAQSVDREVQIGVLQKLQRGVNNGFNRDTLDGILATILRPIKDRLKFRALGTAPNQYKWVGTVHEPLYDPEHLDKYGQFTSVVTFRYRRIEK